MGSRIDTPVVVRPPDGDILAFIRKTATSAEHQLGYRGHANSAWELKPTLARLYESLPVEKKRSHTYKEIQAKILRKFSNNLVVNGDLRPEQIASINLWEYGQHFGLPTHLLDWTYSAYVALFFAAHDQPGEVGNHALWTINLSILRTVNLEVGKVEDKGRGNVRLEPIDVQSEPSYFNRRLAYQQGFFTKHDQYLSFEPWLREAALVMSHPIATPPLLTKIEFSLTPTERSKLLAELNSMNINSRVLFPDVKGSVDDARDFVEHDVRPRTVKMSFVNDG